MQLTDFGQSVPVLSDTPEIEVVDNDEKQLHPEEVRVMISFCWLLLLTLICYLNRLSRSFVMSKMKRRRSET